ERPRPFLTVGGAEPGAVFLRCAFLYERHVVAPFAPLPKVVLRAAGRQSSPASVIPSVARAVAQSLGRGAESARPVRSSRVWSAVMLRCSLSFILPVKLVRSSATVC